MARPLRAIAFGLTGFLFVTTAASAQGVPGLDSRGALPAGTPPLQDGQVSAVSSATTPKKPGIQEARPRYPSDPANYPSSTTRLRTQKVDPSSAAAQRESGLGPADAASLMSNQGYTHVGEVRAHPNSIWVWEADAMKNGRRVRLGVDYRGNLLELSGGQPQPCAVPGVGFGGGSMGVGSRLSEATNCGAR